MDHPPPTAADTSGRPPRPRSDAGATHATLAFPPAPAPWPTPSTDPYGRLVAPAHYTRSRTWTGGLLSVDEEAVRSARRGRERGVSASSAAASPRACVPVSPLDWPALEASSASSSSSGQPPSSSSASSDDEDGKYSLHKSLTVGAASDALAPPPRAHHPRRPRLDDRPWAAAAPLILSTEVATNLAYYSVSVNLVLYLTSLLGANPAEAAAHAHMWTGLSYVAPLAGGALADAWLGRPLTILVAVAVFTVGLATLAAQAFLLAPGVRTGAIIGAGGAPPPPPPRRPRLVHGGHGLHRAGHGRRQTECRRRRRGPVSARARPPHPRLRRRRQSLLLQLVLLCHQCGGAGGVDRHCLRADRGGLGDGVWDPRGRGGCCHPGLRRGLPRPPVPRAPAQGVGPDGSRPRGCRRDSPLHRAHRPPRVPRRGARAPPPPLPPPPPPLRTRPPPTPANCWPWPPYG